MKSKKIIIFTVISVVIIFITIVVLLSFRSKNKNTDEIHTSLTDIVLKSDESEGSLVSNAFKQQISIEIKKINKETETASIEISVPILSDTLEDIVNKSIDENPDMSYDELIDLTENSIADALNSGKFKIKVSTLNVPYQEINGKVSIVPNDELYDLIYGELQDMYMNLLIEAAEDWDYEIIK